MNPLDTIKGTIIAGFVLALVLGLVANSIGKKSGVTAKSMPVPAAVKSKK